MAQGMQGGPVEGGGLGGLARVVQALTGAYMARQGMDEDKAKMAALTKVIGEASDVMTNPDLGQDGNIPVNKADFRGAQFPEVPADAQPMPGLPGQPDIKPAQVSFDMDKVNAAPSLDPTKRQAMAQALLAKNEDMAPLIAQQRFANIFKGPQDETVAEGGMIVTKNADGTYTKKFENPKDVNARAPSLTTMGKSGAESKTLNLSDPADLATFKTLQAQGYNEIKTPGATISIDQRQDSAEKTARGGDLVKEFTGIRESADAAQNALASLQTARAIKDLPGGALEPVKAKVGAFAQALGIQKENLAALGLDNATDAEAFTGIMQNLVLAKMQAQKGPQTENDARRIEQTVASLGNRPEARDFLMRAAVSNEQTAILKRYFYEDFEAKNNTLSGASKAWRDYMGSTPMVATNPNSNLPVFFTEFAEGVHKAEVAAGHAPPTAEQVLAEWKAKYVNR